MLPKSMVTYLDGKWVDDADATVSVRSRALNYGLGCFGGIRGYLADDREQVFVFRLDKHVERLEFSAHVLFLKLPGNAAHISQLVVETVRRNQVHHDVYIRPMLIHNSTALAPVLRDDDSTLIIFCQPLDKYFGKDAIDVCVSSWRRVQDSAIPARTKPTGAYLNSALARREAHDNGYDEAIFLTREGRVSEGSAEHIFLIRDGMLHTPPSTEDNLDGITRRTLITLAREDLGLKVIERQIGRTELYVCEEMFLCGTGAQITPVRSVDRRAVGSGDVGSITRRLQRQFDDAVHGRIPNRRNWLTPVWG